MVVRRGWTQSIILLKNDTSTFYFGSYRFASALRRPHTTYPAVFRRGQAGPATGGWGFLRRATRMLRIPFAAGRAVRRVPPLPPPQAMQAMLGLSPAQAVFRRGLLQVK